MTDFPTPMRWFRWNRAWHLAETDARSFCGAEPADPPKIVTSETPTDLPPDPCRACVLVAFRDEVEEESLEDCFERGFELSQPADYAVDAGG